MKQRIRYRKLKVQYVLILDQAKVLSLKVVRKITLQMEFNFTMNCKLLRIA